MTDLSCACGKTRLAVCGPPILAAACCCTSCRTAAARLEALPGAAPILGPYGETHFVLYRKDRITLPDTQTMRAFHLPGSKTRRVLAPCCATPLILEFPGGHWLSVYAGLWPEGTAPKAQLRTMVSALPDPGTLPDDIPNARTQSLWFMWRLMTSWIAMGFRAPKLDVKGTLNG